MFINKPLAASILSGIAFVGGLGTVYAQTPALPSPMVSQIEVIDSQYPTPSKIRLPNGEVVEMTIKTLAEMQKKSEIREFEEKVESIFAPDARKANAPGALGNINGFPINLPVPQVDLTPPKPPEPEFVMEDRSIRVLSVYGKKKSLMSEIQTAEGLLNVGENSSLIAGYRVGGISSSGVEIVGPKGTSIVPIGASVSYQVRVKK